MQEIFPAIPCSLVSQGQSFSSLVSVASSFGFLLTLRDSFAIFLESCLRNLGLSILSPFEVVKKWVSPRSRPIALLESIGCLVGSG